MEKLFFTLIVLITSTGSFAQLSLQAKQIESTCKAIDKDNTLQKKVYEQEDFMDHPTDNGGSLTVYHKNGTVYRITEWVGLSGHVVIINYYFKTDKLVYVRNEELPYERNAVTGEITGKFLKNNRFLGKYLFRNDKLFEEISLGHNRFEDDEHNHAEEEFTAAAKNISYCSRTSKNYFQNFNESLKPSYT